MTKRSGPARAAAAGVLGVVLALSWTATSPGPAATAPGATADATTSTASPGAAADGQAAQRHAPTKKQKKQKKQKKRAPKLAPLYVDPWSQAAQAAAADPAFAPIARRPQAFWGVAEYGVDGIGPAVTAYVDAARSARRTPQVVLYALPFRDCGGYSAGGVDDAAAYRTFVRRAAAAVRGGRTLVIVEPDAVPYLSDPGCGDVRARTAMLRFAVATFRRAGAWVYLDGGHSRWHDAATTARLLRKAGVRGARGFALNVSNFGATAQQVRYGAQVNRRLAGVGVRGKRFVVDTSRNGARRPPAPGDWCNPAAARLGRAPAMVRRGQLDGYLWVKRPGESDGACNGAPVAGAWWPEGARLLMQR